MTHIETVIKPEHRLKVECNLSTEFGLTKSFKKEDLETWLARLPEGTRIKFTGISSGNIMMKATWTERR